MKKKLGAVLLAVVLVLTLGLVTAAPVAASYPDPVLAALWHLDTVDTTVSPYTTPDSSGNGNTGSLYPVGSEPTFVAGKFGKALSFDGIDDYVQVAHADSLDMTSAYTIEAWVNVTDVPSNVYRPIVFRGTTNANDIEVYVQAISDDLVVAHNRGNGGTFDFVRFADPPIGTLFHLVVTFDGTNVQAYYNGSAATVNQNTTAMVAPLDTNKDWWIGKVDHTAFGTLPGGSPINLFKGLIDEVRIWAVALTQGQIDQSYALGTTLSTEATTVLKEKFLADGGVAIFTSAFYWPSGGTSYGSGVILEARAMIVGSSATVSDDLAFRGSTPRGWVSCTVDWTPTWGFDLTLTAGSGSFVDGAKSLHQSMILSTGEGLGFNIQNLPYK